MPYIDLIKVLVSLGVPGVALGLFYLLFKNFSFSFSKVPRAWTGPIVVLFMLLAGYITYYALTLWAPQKAPATVSTQPLDTGSGQKSILEDELRILRFLEKEGRSIECEISYKLSLSSSASEYLIQKLIEREYIFSSSLRVNPKCNYRGKDGDSTISIVGGSYPMPVYELSEEGYLYLIKPKRE